MNGVVQSSEAFTLARDGRAGALAGELRGWAWIAVGALALAGVFALLLALSRVPGMDRAPLWPIGFFYKGLVIHVVFSLVIWLLGVFAFLTTVATREAAGDAPRARASGRIGQGIALVAFPCLFAPAFLDQTQPELTNYIPLLRHPLYDLGLTLLALGALAPVLRLFVNLPGRRPLPAITLAMALAGFVFVLALVSFGVAGVLLAPRDPGLTDREALFWGGGHLMQFVYAILVLTNWRLLALKSLGPKSVDDGVFRVAVSTVAVFAAAGPLFYAAFEPFSVRQHDAFRFLQFGLALPTLVFAIALVRGARAALGPRPWPWRDPAFFTLAASLALFALGGAMGFLISGSDTRTPAHYHAVVTAVSVSSAGMLMTFGLDALGLRPVSARAVRWPIGLYAGGQFVASAAMFVAGGYGALRKTPSGVGSLDPVAAAGMAAHGIASIVTIIGGAAFVVVAIRALARRKGRRAMSATAAAPARKRGEWAALAVLFVAGLGILGVLEARRTPAPPGLVEILDRQPAKLSAFVDGAGRPVSIESFRGRTVILNLWAPWCVPCLQEMPSLDRLAARLPDNDFAVVAVTRDPVGESPSKRTFDRMGLKRLKLYLDPEGKLGPEIGARGFPTTLIVGRDGAPLAYREGAADWDSDAMAARLEALAAAGEAGGAEWGRGRRIR